MGLLDTCRVRGCPRCLRGACGVSHLEVAVHHEAAVHVLQAQDYLSRVEPHLCLREDAVLGQVIMQVSPCDNRDLLSPWHCPLCLRDGAGKGL